MFWKRRKKQFCAEWVNDYAPDYDKIDQIGTDAGVEYDADTEDDDDDKVGGVGVVYACSVG